MRQLRTSAIILRRIDYGEADRILTLITPDAGKLSLIAKGVRRIKSKIAGGIELFSTSEITYIPGRGSVGTLVSARLQRHYGDITKNIERTMLGYELIKLLDKVTEDEPEQEYYDLLDNAFRALEDNTISVDLVRVWFSAQLLRMAGYIPNLQTTVDGAKRNADVRYEFDYDSTAFRQHEEGIYGVNEIKFLRLVFSGNAPAVLAKVANAAQLAKVAAPLIQTLRQYHLRT
jgi:DNA repair protein RecO (recombination protein O)